MCHQNALRFYGQIACAPRPAPPHFHALGIGLPLESCCCDSEVNGAALMQQAVGHLASKLD